MMIRPSFLLAICLAPAVLYPALASPHCHAPMAGWQPKQALEDKLKAEGWQLHRIKTDDGCYKVIGTRADGKRVKAIFAPDTLEMLRERVRED